MPNEQFLRCPLCTRSTCWVRFW